MNTIAKSALSGLSAQSKIGFHYATVGTGNSSRRNIHAEEVFSRSDLTDCIDPCQHVTGVIGFAGWDITDYGQGNFDKIGFSLITIRNGSQTMKEKYPKVYAEKLLYLKEGQYSPNHFHWYKTEDIINRGGGNVLIRVYNSKPDESIDYESDVTVHTDGRTYTVPAGTQIRLTPGESIFITQYLYHDFEVEPGTGSVLLGEVSQCNDDAHDNRFNPPMGRFPAIEEDEAPYRLLCTEYPKAKD